MCLRRQPLIIDIPLLYVLLDYIIKRIFTKVSHSFWVCFFCFFADHQFIICLRRSIITVGKSRMLVSPSLGTNHSVTLDENFVGLAKEASDSILRCVKSVGRGFTPATQWRVSETQTVIYFTQNDPPKATSSFNYNFKWSSFVFVFHVAFSLP